LFSTDIRENAPATERDREEREPMSFCDHCEGQRFDRARVLRVLRQAQKDLRATNSPRRAEEVLAHALHAVKALDIPHLEFVDEGSEIVH
jgi:hypothetical protein